MFRSASRGGTSLALAALACVSCVQPAPGQLAQQANRTNAPTPMPTPSATLTPLPTPLAPVTPTVRRLRVGESTMIALPGMGGSVKLTVESAEDHGAPPPVRPGMTLVSVVIRYENNLVGEMIQVTQSPWQMASADGVRRTPTFPGRRDPLQHSVIPAGEFVVGSLSFEVPPGPLQLVYTQPSAPGNLVFWQVR